MQAEAEAYTPFASPSKRIKTPSASSAVCALASSPDTPQQPAGQSRAGPCGGGLSQGSDNVAAALAAVSGFIDSDCAAEEHALSAAGASLGYRAGGRTKSGRGAGAQRAAAARPVQTAKAEQSSQGMPTPAKQPQARPSYTAQKATARDALAAAHQAAAKRIAQVLLLRPLPWVTMR